MTPFVTNRKYIDFALVHAHTGERGETFPERHLAEQAKDVKHIAGEHAWRVRGDSSISN